MGEKRKHRTGAEILAILKRHHVDKEPVSKICDEAGIAASQFYRWQAQLFTDGAAVFERKSHQDRRQRLAERERLAMLEEKLQKKNEVVAELMEEHIKLKKSLGES